MLRIVVSSARESETLHTGAHMKVWMVLLLPLVLIFCAGNSTLIRDEDQTILDIGQDVSVLGFAGIDGRWMPTKGDTDEAIESVYTYLKEQVHSKDYYAGEIARIIKNFRNYNVQFFGIERNHQQIIGCNFLSSAAIPTIGSRWKDDIVIVHDGGYWFWRIEFNVDLKKCQYLSINGYA